jgi:hypothetical protein
LLLLGCALRTVGLRKVFGLVSLHMKTLTFSSGIHVLSRLKCASLNSQSQSTPSLFSLHACRTWINLTSFLLPQVYQLSRRSPSTYGHTLTAPFCVPLASSHSAIIFCREILSLGFSLPLGLTHAPFTYKLARSGSTQRPLLHSPSALGLKPALTRLRYLLPCLRLPSGDRPLTSSMQRRHLCHVDGTRDCIINRYTRRRPMFHACSNRTTAMACPAHALVCPT